MEYIIIFTPVVICCAVLLQLYWNQKQSKTKKMISDEELNFWKIYLLCYKLATESVRIYFHRQIPKSSLESHLNKWKTQLDPIPANKTKFKCFPAQFDLLFPAAPVKVCSSKFDFSLLYKLIRNTVPNLPTYTWGQQLANLGYTDLDDIERIRHYRNELAHNTKMAISNRDFLLQWTFLSAAVTRLSNSTLSSNVRKLEKQTLDLRARDDTIKHIKREMVFVREEISGLQQDVCEHDVKLKGHESHINEHDTRFQDYDRILDQQKIKFKEQDAHFHQNNAKFADQDKKCEQRDNKLKEHDSQLQRLSNPIPENVKQQTASILKHWKINDRVFYSATRAYIEVVKTVASEKITAIVGSPGTGKSATAHHIALEYETKGWQVIPVTSLEHVVEYSDPAKKQVFVIDDLFGVFTSDMSVYNSFRKCHEKLINGTCSHFKLLLTSRKSAYNEVMGKIDDIVVVDMGYYALNIIEKKEMFAKHCQEKALSNDIFEQFTLTTQFMFPFLCSQFVSNTNYQNCGERFFTNPHECIIDELDRLKDHNQIQYTSLVLCLLSNNKLEIMNADSELKSNVINRCCDSTGVTDAAITKALINLTEVYITRTGNQFSFLHDSMQEIVGYHFGKDNIDLFLKYMSCSFVWSMITVPKEAKHDDLCIEMDEKYYPLLAQRMFNDINDKYLLMEEIDHVFRNTLFSHSPFVKALIEFLEGLDLKQLMNFVFVVVRIIEHYPNVPWRYTMGNKEYFNLLINENDIISVQDVRHLDGIDRHETHYKFKMITLVLFYGHTNFLNGIFRLVKRQHMSKDILIGNEDEQQRLITLACLSGQVDIVQYMLTYIETTCLNKYYRRQSFHKEYSPLTAACSTGNTKLIQYLLKRGASIHIYDGDFMYPIEIVVEHGHLEAVKYILQHMGDPNVEFKSYLLCQATIEGHIDIVRYFVSIGADVNYSYKTPPHALSRNHVKYLLKSASYYKNQKVPSLDGQTPLLIAAALENAALVIYFLERGANVNICDKNSESALLKIARGEGYGNCLMLICHKKRQERRLKIAKYLLDYKININKKNLSGESPLYVAAEKQDIAMVNLFIRHGVDFNICSNTNTGASPIINSLMFGFQRLVLALVKGENNWFKNKQGNARLFETIANLRNVEIVYLSSSIEYMIKEKRVFSNCLHFCNLKTLLKLGIDVNNCNSKGDSLLLVYLKYGLGDFLCGAKDISIIIDLLVENHANLNYRNITNEALPDTVEKWRNLDSILSDTNNTIYCYRHKETFIKLIPNIRSVMEFLELCKFFSVKDKRKLGLESVKKHLRRRSL